MARRSLILDLYGAGKIKRIFGTHPEMIAAIHRLDGLVQAFSVCLLILCIMTSCRRQETSSESQAQKVEAPAVSRQEIQPSPNTAQQEVRLPSEITQEILGRWKIIRQGSCGISAISDEEADWYIGKTVSIDRGQMMFKERDGTDYNCNFTDISISVEETGDYLGGDARCTPSEQAFLKIKEKKIKVFHTTPGCAGTPFNDSFKPNDKTLVIQFQGAYLFMERDTIAVVGMEQGGVQSPAPAGLTKR